MLANRKVVFYQQQQVHGSRSGFAVILSLSLMSFVVLLLLSVTLSVRVETANAANSLDQLLARENARLGAYIALGELQRLAGPDQRATAPSGLLSSAVPNLHWTGVWDGSDYRADQPENRPFLAWLASGAPVESTLSETDRISVVNQNFDPSDDGVALAPEVVVGREPLPGGRAGEYGWWISDESTKFKIAVNDPYGGIAQSDIGQEEARRLLPGHFDWAGVESLAPGLVENLRELFSEKGPKVVMREDAGFIEPGLGSLVSEGFHEFTTHSLGLLTNSKDGGLRRNLTHLFESDLAFGSVLSGKRVFQPEDYQTGSLIDGNASFYGPRWEVLRDYYLNRAAPVADAEMNMVIGPAYAGTSDPFLSKPDSLDWMGRQLSEGDTLTTEPVNNRMTPVFTRVGLYFRARTEPLGDGSGQYRMLFDLYPRLTLWNPYSVSLRLGGGLKRFQIELLPNIAIFRNGALATAFTLRGIRNATVDYTNFNIDLPTTVLAPGEMRVFGLSSREVDLKTATGNSLAAYLEPYHAADAAIVYDVADYLPGFRLDPADNVEIRWHILSKFTGLASTKKYARFWLTENVGVATTLQNIDYVYLDDLSLVSHPPIPVSGLNSLESIPLEMGGIEIRLKHADETSSAEPINPLAHFNPRAIYNGQIAGDYLGPFAPNWAFELLDSEPVYQDFIDTPGGLLLQDSWGSGYEELGERRVVLFDVPRSRLTSVGQLRHANISSYANQPAYAVGNSLADPHVPASRIADRRDGISFTDLSWLMNDSLFDEYFFTGKEPGLGIDFALGEHLPNPRLVPFDPSVDSAALDSEEAAALLAVDGPFNVNSVSVDAWTAFLAGLGGEGFSSFDSFSDTSFDVPASEHPFFRLLWPMGPDPDSWRSGIYDLDILSLRGLANKIVDQVRLRGPFLHLSDFLNRRLSDDALGRSGALQAAIDQPGGINDSVEGAFPVAPTTEYPFPDNRASNQSAGSPPHLTQADLVASLAPFLTTRGDTFLIRAYGAVSASVSGGVPDTEVWLEAIVQRTVDPVYPDPTDRFRSDPDVDVDFGRRFQIVSLRWLNREEAL